MQSGLNNRNVHGIQAAFVSESLGASAGPAWMELLLNTIYFLKHLDQQELALCLGNLLCLLLTSLSSDTADGIHVRFHRDEGCDIHGVMLMGWVQEP